MTEIVFVKVAQRNNICMEPGFHIYVKGHRDDKLIQFMLFRFLFLPKISKFPAFYFPKDFSDCPIESVILNNRKSLSFGVSEELA